MARIEAFNQAHRKRMVSGTKTIQSKNRMMNVLDVAGNKDVIYRHLAKQMCEI